MTARKWKPVLEQIRSLAAARPDSSVTDAELVNRFIARRDEGAFEALLRRHGPMVLRVARRVLGSEPDAEDVFQAAFLLLARRAGALRKRDSVASWLHTVAHRLALSARGERARRQERERVAAAARSIESLPEPAWSELEVTLHEALEQLPKKYRTPLVYCYLEGWTQEEVARQLGKPLGTVRSWLARGRELLRKRLLRRGVSLSVEGASAALLASACARAEAVPASLRMATLKAAHLLAAGGSAMTLISPPVAALVRKGLMTMLAAKLKSGAAWVLVVAVLVAGTGWAAHRTFSAKPPEANEAEKSDPPKQSVSENRPRTDAFGDLLPPGAVVQVGTQDSRSTGAFFAVAFSPDGKRLVAGYHAPPFRLWDVATGKEADQFPGHQEPVFAVAFSPDGKYLASGGYDGTVRLWNVSTHEQLFLKTDHQREVQSTVRAVAFSPDGKILASGALDQTIRLWEVPTGKNLGCLRGHDYYVMGLSFSPDGKTLASAGWDMTVRLWNVATGEEMRRFKGHRGGVSSVDYSPNGQVLVSASHDKTIRFWRASTGKEAGHPIELSNEVHAVALSPDGRTLASGSRDGMVRLWEVATRREVLKFEPKSGPITGLAFAADGRSVASVESKGMAHVWDVTGLRRPVSPAVCPAREPQALWADLTGGDTVRAYRALWLLVDSPRQALPLLSKQLRPHPLPAQDIKRWIIELNDDRFEVREKAETELEKYGQKAEPFLRRALGGAHPLESRRRIERLLEKLPKAALSPEQVRMERALAVLERIGTRDAREVLEPLTKAGPDSWLGQEAKASLQRLDQRTLRRP